ncbi:methyltransferase domain-containing protein [Acidipropionibacterium jensenii]|uniref:methyltransferase domain-containing protein n=1 Tax=Acidipropionibacterium jensenii TaxID=1749 RepID=UPI000BC3182F
MTGGLSQVVDWLICPTCRRRTGTEEGLELTEHTLRCRHGHSLDVARQGHVTMIPARPGINADTTEMVAARQRVLDAGIFDPVDAVMARQLALSQRILEAGAGTGHHLGKVLDAVGSAHGLASDVSVAAVRRAARAHPRMAAVVADTWRGLPLRSGSVDAVMCVFAPRNRQEFHRVLSAGGLLVVVTPLSTHLAELREATGMIGIQPDKRHQMMAGLMESFTPSGHQTVRSVVTLDPRLAADAVGMGPSAHHATHVDLSDPIAVTVAVEVTTFLRRGGD